MTLFSLFKCIDSFRFEVAASYALKRVCYPQLFLLLCFVSITGCATTGSNDVVVGKSPNDTREYRVITLRNAMQVLLISDAQTDKAAAAVDINAGSNSDPDAFPGLAHFLEHMLFLGTGKYPEAGEYQEFISSHGGSHNAYTAYENTNYYFDIDREFLPDALDRFSQFFIDPLFTPEYVERERNAVHSEYQSGLQDDGRRGYSALKNLTNPKHPLSRFSVGSLQTLQDHADKSLRTALQEHYTRYYSANLMTAAILGSQSLDELEALARTYFSPVKNARRKAPRTSETLFPPGMLPGQLWIEPVRDNRSLTFTFPITPVNQYFEEKPLHYLGNLLGHEGEGSLLALLRGKGWANSLSAGGGFAYTDTATFTVNIGLTEEGISHVDDIAALLFQFIELIRADGVHDWLFNEEGVMAALAFQFQEPVRPISYVSSMSRRMQELPANELITAAYAYRHFDAALVNSVLNQLRDTNVLLTFVSKTVEGDQVDPWYGTRFRRTVVPAARLHHWRSFPHEPALAISKPNPFLPEDVSIKPYNQIVVGEALLNVEDKPSLIRDEGGIRLWFKQDVEFQTPRANFFVYALTPGFGDTLRNSLLSGFVVSLVNDQLNEFSYPANLAGVFFGLTHRSRGFSLSVGGYNDKQPQLLEALLQTLVAADFSDERFEIIRTEMIRSWENAALQTPYVRLFEETQALLMMPYWSEAERIAMAQSITLDDVKRFVPQMLSGVRLDALYHGNVLPSDATAMLDIVTRYIRPDPNAPIPPLGLVLKMPEATRVVQEMKIDHDDSAIVIYQQGIDDSLKTRALIQLLGNIVAPSFYDTLRTEKQLGYIVNAGSFPILNTSGLVMYIESPVADPLALEANINQFLSDFAEELAVMPEATFNSIKAGLLTNLRIVPQRLSDLSSRFWGDIQIGELQHDSTLQLADAIEALTQAEVVAYFKSHVANPLASRLVARTAGRAMRADFEEARTVSDQTVILDDGVADYRPFKERSEHYEFR